MHFSIAIYSRFRRQLLTPERVGRWWIPAAVMPRRDMGYYSFCIHKSLTGAIVLPTIGHSTRGPGGLLVSGEPCCLCLGAVSERVGAAFNYFEPQAGMLEPGKSARATIVAD
jgi:hypothetical protein